ncbi:MAG: DUF2911 domain-containing protein [Bacteroidia bacterium]
MNYRPILYVAASLLLFAVACSTAEQSSNTENQTSDTSEVVVAPATTTASLATVTVLNDSIPSPRKRMTATLGTVAVTVEYGSPSVKGRTLWGSLVPYGEVWRTGANEATTITFSAPVTIGTQTLAAGTYGLFTIPGESDWTIIFNQGAEQWGAYEYNESKDVLRTKVVPQTAETASETLEFDATEGTIMLRWGNLVVPFAVAAA